MRKLLLVIFVCSAFLMVNCSDDATEEFDKDSLTVEENAFIEALPKGEGLTPDQMYLPNELSVKDFLLEVDPEFYNQFGRNPIGTSGRMIDAYENLGPQDSKNRLIAAVTLYATNIMDRSKHQVNNQNGYAYSYGSKDFELHPPTDGECHRDTDLAGVDCVGFLYQAFSMAGVSSFPKHVLANQLREPTRIENAIRSSIPALNKIEVKDLGMLPTNKFEAGDIIYWKRGENKKAFHVGIIINLNGQLVVAQSNGTDVSSGDCEKNLGLNRGPNPVQLGNSYWFGSNFKWGIVRINASISNKYKFHFACYGSSSDFFIEDLTFPTNTDNAFDIIKPFIDSDGSNNVANFHFVYDSTTNVLSASVITTDASIPGFERKDHFSVKLKRDNIPYFLMTNDYFHNGSGCTTIGKFNYVE